MQFQAPGTMMKILSRDARLDKVLLNEAKFGKFRVQTGLIMRDSNFVSKVLLNSEVWHSVTKSQVEDLKVVDRLLL